MLCDGDFRMQLNARLSSLPAHVLQCVRSFSVDGRRRDRRRSTYLSYGNDRHDAPREPQY